MTLQFFVASSQKDVDMLKLCKVKNILISFAYMDKVQEDLSDLSHTFDKIFIDSGAFTAQSKELNLDLDKYIEYLNENKQYIFTAAQLDVVGDVDATVDNYEYMIDHGCEWVSPVLQGMYPYCLSRIKKVGLHTDYIHVGNNGWYHDRGIDSEEKIFTLPRNYKYHGLARAGEQSWRRKAYYSTDSSSWLAAAQYGEAEVYLKNERFMVKVGHENRKEDLMEANRVLYMCKDDLNACEIKDEDVKRVDRDTLSRMNIALFYRPLMRRLGIFDKNFFS